MPFPVDVVTASEVTYLWKQPSWEYFLHVIFKVLFPNTGSIH